VKAIAKPECTITSCRQPKKNPAQAILLFGEAVSKTLIYNQHLPDKLLNQLEMNQ
jgi:hypothetical protein